MQNQIIPSHPRKIRSYSCRETRLNVQHREVLETAWPRYGIELVEGQMFNWDKIFARSAPRIVEIGFGDGASLLAMAKACPDKDFIGVEVYRRGVARLLAGIVKDSLCNIRVIQHDAVEVLSQHVPDKSLQGVQIYFADPWPKNRHHKRRLIQPDFIKLLSEKLLPGGSIHCATDWENYAQHMLEVLSQDSNFLNKADKGSFIERPDFRPVTKYERRAIKEGRSIFDLMFERG